MIAMRQRSARIVPVRKVPKLYGQPSGLDGIESTVVALNIVVILLRLAVIANHLHALSHLFIIGRDGATFAAGTKILSRIKTERSRLADGARFFPSVGLL